MCKYIGLQIKLKNLGSKPTVSLALLSSNDRKIWPEQANILQTLGS